MHEKESKLMAKYCEVEITEVNGSIFLNPYKVGKINPDWQGVWTIEDARCRSIIIECLMKKKKIEFIYDNIAEQIRLSWNDSFGKWLGVNIRETLAEVEIATIIEISKEIENE